MKERKRETLWRSISCCHLIQINFFCIAMTALFSTQHALLSDIYCQFSYNRIWEQIGYVEYFSKIGIYFEHVIFWTSSKARDWSQLLFPHLTFLDSSMLILLPPPYIYSIKWTTKNLTCTRSTMRKIPTQITGPFKIKNKI